MLIKDMFSTVKPVVSFEIFPPKKDTPVETVYQTIEALKDLHPNFISVTYGAGGSGADKTVEIASIIKNKYNIEALAHLTCISSTKDKVSSVLNELKANNISNVLAMRGDLPQDPDFSLPNPLHYTYAENLVSDIHSRGGFCIGGACYPEGHIECTCMEDDLANLKRKVDSGVDFLITQLFFNNEFLYDFKEKMYKLDIKIPALAGIMPVLNKKQVERIVSMCGSTIPKKFMRIMEKYEHKPDALKEAGIAYATEQIIDLLSWGMDGVHIYTMNRPEVTRKIVENISTIRNVLTGIERKAS